MTPRAASMFVAVCLLLSAVLLAVVPFSYGLPGIDFSLNCDPPVAAAWSSGNRDPLTFWAVRVRTNMAGDGGNVRVVGNVGPWCRAPARQRLLVSAGLVVAAVAIGVAGQAIWRRDQVALV